MTLARIIEPEPGRITVQGEVVYNSVIKKRGADAFETTNFEALKVSSFCRMKRNYIEQGADEVTPKEYTTQYRLFAKGLAAEGWSRSAIGKELGIPRQTIDTWLQSGHAQIAENGHSGANAESRLSTKLRYHLANCRLEDFQPPQGLTFPLIIADPPWNISPPF